MKKIYTFLGVAFFTLNTFATTLVVTNTNDTGTGSMRDAITTASNGDTIAFNSSLAGSTINLNSTITIDKSLVVDGASSGSYILVSGNYSFRLISIITGPTVYFNRVNFTKGQVTTGGAILNSGELILTYCRFFENRTLVTNDNQGGGAIFNNTTGYLFLNYCEFYDNSSISSNSKIPHGGAIYNRGQYVEINFSSFHYNKATAVSSLSSYGGAIHNNSGPIVINSSTFSNNECTAAFGASSYGGAISTETASNIDLKNSTFVYNKSISGSNAFGGNISNYGTLSIENTILGQGIAAVALDVHTQTGVGTSTSLGYNLVQYTNGSIISFQSSDIIAAPDVDTLTYINGSFTKVRPIRCSSPAVDAGNSASAPVTDQIGQTRNIGSTVDIGAFERQSTDNYHTINPTACDSYTSPSGNYTYTNSASFMDTTYSTMGCANIITINLTVNTSPNVIANAQSLTICEGDTTTITGFLVGSGSYLWNNGLGAGQAHDVFPITNTTYIVTGTDNSTGCSNIDSITIMVNAIPVPSINQSGNDLVVTATFSSYQWYYNGNILAAETNQTITPTLVGTYMVVVTNSNSCSGSASFNYSTVGMLESSSNFFSIYPNPAKDIVNVILENQLQNAIISIIDVTGKLIFETKIMGTDKLTLDVANMKNGIYLMRLTKNSELLKQSKIVVQH